MLSELLEEYKESSDDRKLELVKEFTNMLWKSKYVFKTYKKYYTYRINESALNNRSDLIELFNKYKTVEFIFCKSYYKKGLESIDYIRVHVNNMFGFLVNKEVYLSKDYYQLLLTPKDEYYLTIEKLKNGEDVDCNEIEERIILALKEAEQVKEKSLEKKLDIKWKDYKKLINTYIERLFNNYMPQYEYEEKHGWQMQINIDGWNEDNYVIRYFSKSLTGYLRNYVKASRPKEIKEKKCAVCNIDIENTVNNKKYCESCAKTIQQKQKNKWNVQKRSVDKVDETNNDRLGEVNTNKFGTVMSIIRYGSYKDIDILFEGGYIVKNAQYANFKKGAIKNPYDKNHYERGFVGEGDYRPSMNSVHTPQYTKWKSMLERCYSNKYHKRQPKYVECEVCDEWYNFQNFAKWYDENYYEVEDQVMCLDKDILKKNNKIYSPTTCVFVPKSINSLFVKSDAARGELPIGVKYNETKQKYYVYCGVGKCKKIYLGIFDNSTEAFQAYKEFKEQYVKDVANEYKESIPICLYNAMVNYEVSITD